MIDSAKKAINGIHQVTFIGGRTSNVAAIEGNRDYQSLLKWIENGGILAPSETDAEILERKKNKVDALADEKILATMPGADASNHIKKKLKAISRASKLIRKEAKGNASAGDIAELDALESLEDTVEAITEAAEAIKVLLEGDLDYDYGNSDQWPVA